MSNDFYEIAEEVSRWADETFPYQTKRAKALRIKEESEELVADPKSGEEMADVLMVLMHLADVCGIDLLNEVERKLEINRKRVWGEPDNQGRRYHVEGGMIAADENNPADQWYIAPEVFKRTYEPAE